MARSLIQSLEGIAFPCDRERLIEYARTHDATSTALESLTAMPPRRYANMTEVLEAVPSKSEARRRAGARPEPSAGPAEEEDEPAGEKDPAQAWTRWVTATTNAWWRLWFPWLR